MSFRFNHWWSCSRAIGAALVLGSPPLLELVSVAAVGANCASGGVATDASAHCRCRLGLGEMCRDASVDGVGVCDRTHVPCTGMHSAGLSDSAREIVSARRRLGPGACSPRMTSTGHRKAHRHERRRLRQQGMELQGCVRQPPQQCARGHRPAIALPRAVAVPIVHERCGRLDVGTANHATDDRACNPLYLGELGRGARAEMPQQIERRRLVKREARNARRPRRGDPHRDGAAIGVAYEMHRPPAGVYHRR